MKKNLVLLFLFFVFTNLFSQETLKLDSVNFKYNNSNEWLGWQKCGNKFTVELNETDKKIILHTNTNVTYKYQFSVNDVVTFDKNVSVYAVDNYNKDVVINTYYVNNTIKYLTILYLTENFQISYKLKNK